MQRNDSFVRATKIEHALQMTTARMPRSPYREKGLGTCLCCQQGPLATARHGPKPAALQLGKEKVIP